jgi:nitroreductase
LMLVLESFGIACIAQAALAVYSDYLHEFFSIPADRWVVCGLSVGYADSSHPSYKVRTTRAALDEIVTWYD